MHQTTFFSGFLENSSIQKIYYFYFNYSPNQMKSNLKGLKKSGMDQILKLDRFVNNVSNQKIQDELTDMTKEL